MKLTEMELTDTQITRYETGCFFIDIVDDGKTFEAWLTEKGTGASTLMFGLPKEQPTERIDFDCFLEIVEGNLDEYRYEYYRREYTNFAEDDDEL